MMPDGTLGKTCRGATRLGDKGAAQVRSELSIIETNGGGVSSYRQRRNSRTRQAKNKHKHKHTRETK